MWRRSSVNMAELEASSMEDVESVVFLCIRCHLPLGDSGDQKTNLDHEDVILLTGVTDNVEINEEKTVSLGKLDAYSTVQILFCKGCSSSLGVFYVGTPRQLEYRRDLFSLNKCGITCYSFTYACKQRARKSEENHRNVSSVEEQLKKCRIMFGQCARAVTQMEKKIVPSLESD